VADERLTEAGYALGDSGAVVLSGPAAELFKRWRQFLAHRLASLTDVTIETPVFIDRHVLTTSKYVAHFAAQVFVGRGYRAPRSRPRFLAPAACLHWYGSLEGRAVPNDHRSAFVVGPCARVEGGRAAFPYRLATFHMGELVVLGVASAVEEEASSIEHQLAESFRGLGIGGGFRAATDAFFLPSSRGARLMQQLKELKREFVSPLDGHDIALASINRHEDFFARAFRITLASGAPAHSFCVAFGLERLTAAGLLTWGPDPAQWPKALSL
jgi:seryl-tRNA synthetase